MPIDYPKLYETAAGRREAFRDAKPFPHIVIDRFLDPGFYANARTHFPAVNSDIWKMPSNDHTQQKMVTKRGDHDVKELLYTDGARATLRELNSAAFLHFLEVLSGIQGLIPDPYLAEAGFHCTGDGGFLDIHADFSHHDGMGLERRLNLIYFLNDGWQSDYGGSLNLYDEALKPAVSVEPIGNRCVLFETSDISYHGHPEPMRLPPGTYRRSIAMYYYTVPRPEREKKRIVFPADKSFRHEETHV